MTYPSNPNRDWTATQAAAWRTPSPDVPTMAAYLPPTQARPAYGPAYRSEMAWSAEQPEFNSAPAAYPAQQRWYARPRVLAFAGAGLVAVAATGLFGALLDGFSSSTPVNTAAQSAPAPAAAPAPAPIPAPQPSARPYRPAYHPPKSGGGYSAPANQHAPQTPPGLPAAPQTQPDQSGQSHHDSQWNNSGNHWWTHSGDHDNRWRSDHDSRSNVGNRDHDSRNSSNDQSSDSHSTGSNENGDSK